MATRRWSSKAIWMRSGWVRGSIYWVLLVLGSVCCYKTIIPDSKEHPFASSAVFPHAIVRWIRAKADKSRMLDEFVAMVGCHRKHAVRLLGQSDEPKERKVPRATGFTTRLSSRR